MMKIGIIGAGGAGGYFAGRWAEAGLDVTLIARGEHLEAMHKHGLTIISLFGDAHIRIPVDSDPSTLASADIVLYATKTWQLAEAIQSSSPHIGPDTLVFGIQNGVESIDVLRSTFPERNVLGATCRIISFIDKPGVIRHVGVEPEILIGEPGGGDSERVQQLASTLSIGQKLSVILSPNIILELWKKFLFFAPVSGIGSVTRCTIGEFRAVEQTRELLAAALHEIVAVARAANIMLKPETADRVLDFIDTLPTDGTSSMQRDFSDGRRTELEALSGHVSKLGKTLKVATPVHDFIYQSLLPLELKAQSRL